MVVLCDLIVVIWVSSVFSLILILSLSLAGLSGGVLQLFLLDLHRPQLGEFLREDPDGVRLQSALDKVAPPPRHSHPRLHHRALLSQPEKQRRPEPGDLT